TAKTEKIPGRVIRFYGNTDYALECVANKEITFIHINKLNDPFDSIFDFTLEFSDYLSLLKHVRSHHPLQVETFKKIVPNQEKLDSLIMDIRNFAKLRENMFVFSTCAVQENENPQDNLYMW